MKPAMAIALREDSRPLAATGGSRADAPGRDRGGWPRLHPLAIAVAAVSLLGLVAELWWFLDDDASSELISLVSLSEEANLPTWFASGLLIACAIVAGSIARTRPAMRWHWWGISAVLAYVAFDEAVQLHEQLGGSFDTGGLLYFDWVIWAALALAVLAAIYLPFVWRLPGALRSRLVGAAVIYVVGALVMELPLGWWTEQHGEDSLGYALIDWFEETLELTGAALAVIALVDHRASLPASRTRYIVPRGYDWAFFLVPPVAALVLGISVSDSWLASDQFVFGGDDDTLVGFFMTAVIHAHLVAVVLRSHGNPEIRRRYPIRFFAVPAILLVAIVASPWFAVLAAVIATFWDVWHSGAQTFGFARIYERNAGTPPELGRRLDFWLNQLLYAGPMLAGATLMDHVDSFDDFAKVGDALLASVPARVSESSQLLTWVVLAVGGAFVVAYVIVYWRLAQRGYRPSWLKLWLVGSTACVSIYSWGFNSWGQAFLIMNLFHGVQYLALVWATEGRRLAARLRTTPHRTLAVFLGAVFAYGVGVAALDTSFTVLWAITIVVSLMHFWYDAFVWSVRKAQI
jgi:hypothetical protein